MRSSPRRYCAAPVDVGFVEAQVLADGVNRKTQPSQALDENEAGAVLVIEDASAAACAGELNLFSS